MNEQKQLTFELGITDVPSDLMCDDNALSESVGMIYENGEHKPIQNPTKIINSFLDNDGETAMNNVEVLYIHKNGSEERYICKYKSGLFNYIGYFSKYNDTLTRQELIQSMRSNTHISSLGNTLIISDNEGVHYYKWLDTHYKDLGDIPTPDVEFILEDSTDDWRPAGQDYYENTYGIVNNDLETKDGKQDDWNNVVVGLYSKNKQLAKKEFRFVGPFFVRAAVKLIDGTYTKATAPILMVPTMKENTYGEWDMHINGSRDLLTFYTYASKLKYKLKDDYSAFSDIIDNITIFVSEQVETLDITKDQPYLSTFWNEDEEWNIAGLSLKEDTADITVRNVHQEKMEKEDVGTPMDAAYIYHQIRIPAARQKSDIDNDIKKVGLFYKLADIGLKPIQMPISPGSQTYVTVWNDIKNVAEEHALENLTTQDRLEDGYYDHTKLTASCIYVYNNRLNLANVQRTLFEGFTRHIPYDNWTTENNDAVKEEYEITSYVTIKTGSKTYVVKNVYTTSERQGIWFYYPDRRAKHVMIFRQQNQQNRQCLLDEDLTEHEALNGAYFFLGLPYDSDYHESAIAGATEPENVPANPQIEALENTIVTSEVNNPFFFKAKGYNEIGTGEIMAITTNTNALSQSQHGQHPLLIFSTSGVWGMSLDDTGLYVSSDNFSREVCNNVDSVTQTDNAVYFSSAKGLMEVRGNTQGNTEVVCVSPQLNKLASLLKDAFIAYDYQHSLLWMMPKTVTGDYQTIYLYNMKSGTFAAYTQAAANKFTSTVNDYPDTLLVDKDGKVFSLMKIPAEAADTEVHYAGSLKTRPIKFGDGMVLKSVREMKLLRDMNASATIAVKVDASNDLKNWNDLKSLRGVPYKYFRLTFTFNHMKATDRFAGLATIVQYRRTNKLR